MTYYNHRRSKDIDIFLRDVQLLTRFTPRLNDYVSSRTDDYTEMSNFLKLKIKQQEIDFIVAPFLTKEPTLKVNSLMKNIDVYQSRIDVLQNRLVALQKVYDIELKALDIIDHRTAKEAPRIVKDFLNTLR